MIKTVCIIIELFIDENISDVRSNNFSFSLIIVRTEEPSKCKSKSKKIANSTMIQIKIRHFVMLYL